MATVILVVHLMIAAALVGIVLLQKSEGGALGIGGGGGGGGFLTGRGTANALTRATAGLAAAFFVTSLTLTILAQSGTERRSVFEAPAASDNAGTPAQPTAPGRGGVLDQLEGGQSRAPLPTVPQTK
jgi:preprotein translocase subunit SecG